MADGGGRSGQANGQVVPRQKVELGLTPSDAKKSRRKEEVMAVSQPLSLKMSCRGMALP